MNKRIASLRIMLFAITIMIEGVSIPASAQDWNEGARFDTSLQVGDKLAAISILSTGDKNNAEFDFPPEKDRPNCWFNYYASKSSLILPEAKLHLRAELLAYIISSYAFADTAAAIIDSIIVNFFPFKKSPVSERSWSFFPVASDSAATPAKRLEDLAYILPFVFEYEIRETGIEILLHQWQGMTPEIDVQQYTNVLAFVIYDYAFHRKRKDIVIAYLTTEGRMIRSKPYSESYQDIFLKQTLSLKPKKISLNNFKTK